ncbi:transposase family protein [Streptomyces sp. NPDC101490]|uniref:transposase family protein n=1 Tax=Streptomyces sp. NPDC101490 TaxID=3366143 RepID=UPI00380C14F5
MPDPRRAKGRRHPLAFVLALAACAVLAGAKSLTAIAEWAADAPAAVLTALGAPNCEPSGPTAPAEATVRRVLQRVDGDALDAAIGAWLNNQKARRAKLTPGQVAQLAGHGVGVGTVLGFPGHSRESRAPTKLAGQGWSGVPYRRKPDRDSDQSRNKASRAFLTGLASSADQRPFKSRFKTWNSQWEVRRRYARGFPDRER